MRANAKTSVQSEIENDLLRLAVSGQNLKGHTFEENLMSPQGTLLVFLRHFGCTFSRKMVADLRLASQKESFPEVIFIHQGSALQGSEFFSKRWPEAIAIADPDHRLYGAFHIDRGEFKQLFAPNVLLQGAYELMKGYGIGLPVGDPLRMPGMFLIRDNRIQWQHEFKHIGDHPDLQTQF